MGVGADYTGGAWVPALHLVVGARPPFQRQDARAVYVTLNPRRRHAGNVRQEPSVAMDADVLIRRSLIQSKPCLWRRR